MESMDEFSSLENLYVSYAKVDQKIWSELEKISRSYRVLKFRDNS